VDVVEFAARVDHPNAICGWRFRVRLPFGAPVVAPRRPRLAEAG
jgi:hypothetical protein